MKLSDIHIRDPFILTEGDKYYLYGTRGAFTWSGKCTGLDVYVSADLDEWSDPIECFTRPEGFWADINFWAPEVHKYKGKYYMFVSLKREDVCRGTQILRADSPLGPFLPISEGPVTPRDWECLDGTFYVDKSGAPWIVFSHEWVQAVDGEMRALRLSDDLTHGVGEAILLFRASEPSWAISHRGGYVTDGPFMYRTAGGRLIMLWSTLAKDGYCEAMAYSQSGEIEGPWIHDDRLLFEKDGGHGMLFKTLDGELKFTLHQPNATPLERPIIVDVVEQDDELRVGSW